MASPHAAAEPKAARSAGTAGARALFSTLVSVCAALGAMATARGDALAAESPAPRQARVRYLSADHVYLDGGRADGLVAGDTLVVERAGRTLGKLVIVHLAEHSAACAPVAPAGVAGSDSTASGGEAALRAMGLRVGDAIRKTRLPGAAAATGTGEGTPASAIGGVGGERAAPAADERAARRRRELPERRPWQSDVPRVSGSASLQWQRYVDDEGTGLDVDQPTLRVSLHARRLWGKDYAFRAQARLRRIDRDRAYAAAPAEEWSHQVAIFSFSYQDPDAILNYQLGRVRATAISGVGALDGALIETRFSSVVRAGLFAGYQPDWRTSEPRGSLRKQGLYARAEHGDWGDTRWAAALAATGEYDGAVISREYLYLRSEYQSGWRWRFFQSAELDINRGWRRDAAGGGVSLTNIYLSAAWRPVERVTGNVSFDDRRNVRTRDTRSLPDSLFDDAFRRGLRAAVEVRLGASWRASGDAGVRRRLGGGAATTSYGAGICRLGLLGAGSRFDARLRGFDGDWVDGWQPTLELHKMFARGDRISVSYGAHLYEPDGGGAGGSGRRTNHWARVEGTRELPGRCFVSGAYEKDWGDDLDGHRVSGEIGVVF